MKYSRNKRYFYPRRFSPAALFLASGSLTTLIGLGKGVLFSVILGGILLAISILLLVLAIYDRTATDEYMDEQLALGTKDILEKAYAQFSLNADMPHIHDPIVLQSYYYQPTKSAPDAATGECKDAPALVREGKDHFPRSNIGEGLVILFGEKNLYWYDLRFSLVFPSDVILDTRVVPYGDIQSVAAEAAKLPCQTAPRFRSMNLHCRQLRIELPEPLSAFMPEKTIDPAAPEIRATVKNAKRRLQRQEARNCENE